MGWWRYNYCCCYYYFSYEQRWCSTWRAPQAAQFLFLLLFSTVCPSPVAAEGAWDRVGAAAAAGTAAAGVDGPVRSCGGSGSDSVVAAGGGRGGGARESAGGSAGRVCGGRRVGRGVWLVWEGQTAGGWAGGNEAGGLVGWRGRGRGRGGSKGKGENPGCGRCWRQRRNEFVSPSRVFSPRRCS